MPACHEIESARDHHDERGAVAVFVAICAVLLFAGAAYAMDAGHLWETRRHIIESADAASLAAAGSLAEGGTSDNACDTVAPDYVAKNVDGATVTHCSVVGAGDDSGHVTVRALTNAEYTFAGIFGNDNKDVQATTTSEWGIPFGVSGLRPFGLCLDATPELEAWLNLPTGPSGPSAEITITYSKAQPASCGSVPGNWAVLDFDGGNNSNADTADWTLNGYPGEIELPSNVPGNPGAFSQTLNQELTHLVNSGAYFGLPVFDTATMQGANSTFHVIAVVFVRLVDFKANGPEAERYMTLVFDQGVLEGRCCNPNGIDTGVRVLRICDVDAIPPNTSDSRAC